MHICFNKSLSDFFSVSNGVRQGGVLSPILFSVYLDCLLQKLADSGVGCHLWVLCVMLTTLWCYWLHVHLH